MAFLKGDRFETVGAQSAHFEVGERNSPCELYPQSKILGSSSCESCLADKREEESGLISRVEERLPGTNTYVFVRILPT